MADSTVRVRFAPSPTGYLHVGGLRTALYNYLFARKQNGVCILRIEDTDRTRFVEGAVENLLSTLDWAGIKFDEGPQQGGPFGPYIQSERFELYRQHAEELLRSGRSYRCFCTAERLDAMRLDQQKKKLPPKYDRTCAHLSKTQIEENLGNKLPFVIRMRIPEAQAIQFHDTIRGEVEFLSDRLDDQVLLKSDGFPTYHLANVVDDHLMQISHVIRGEEWLSSTPKHVLLYDYFGWSHPVFAHLPLLLNPDRSKLSKRQGDVAVEDYRQKGYTRQGLINFIALLGWNPGTEKELFSIDELIQEFSLERVGKAGAVFNIEKFRWLNQQHLRSMTTDEVADLLVPIFSARGLDIPDRDYLKKVITLMTDRVEVVNDYFDFAGYFFKDPDGYDQKAKEKYWKPSSKSLLEAAQLRFREMNSFQAGDIEPAVRALALDLNVKTSEIIHPLRLALSGISIGPGLFDLTATLGKETVLRRILLACEVLG